MKLLTETLCAELQEIAKNYEETSEQFQSIKLASICALYILTKHPIDFKLYLESFSKPLSQDQRANLEYLLEDDRMI